MSHRYRCTFTLLLQAGALEACNNHRYRSCVLRRSHLPAVGLHPRKCHAVPGPVILSSEVRTNVAGCGPQYFAVLASNSRIPAERRTYRQQLQAVRRERCATHVMRGGGWCLRFPAVNIMFFNYIYTVSTQTVTAPSDAAC